MELNDIEPVLTVPLTRGRPKKKAGMFSFCTQSALFFDLQFYVKMSGVKRLGFEDD